MASFFLSIVNISFVASVASIAVILLRLLLKKAPRWVTCLLWALVGLRLVFPFAPESSFSLIPSTDIFTVQSSAGSPATLKVHTGVQVLNSEFNEQISASAQASEQVLSVTDILAIVWVSVAAAVLLYGIISYLLLVLRVRTAIPLKGNVYQSENVKSPFVLGFFKPKIYIPFSLKGRTLKYVLSHEEAHLKRKDHIVKPFAFMLLSIHWFNPFMWVSYVLLCRDIEVACDEKVIKDYSINKRKNYAFALLECKVNRSNIAVCPVAFGEVNVATRIKKTLCYKKPALWFIGVAVTISLLAACCLLTNPKVEAISESKVITTEPTVITTEPSAEITATEVLTEPYETSTPEAEITTETTEVTPENYNYEEYYEAPVTTEKIAETEAPAETAPAEATDIYEENQEYYYYEYDDTPVQEYEELSIEPLFINREDYTSPPYEGYSSDFDFGISTQNNVHTPTFPVIVWDPQGLDNPNSINSFSIW